MWLTKVKVAVLAVVVTASLLGGLGVIAPRLWAPARLPEASAAPVPSEETNGPRAQATLAIPGGLVDPADNAIYVMNTDGGIDALEIKTGKLLWKTPKGETYLPLAVVDKRVVARMLDQKEIRIAVLDSAEKGKQLLKSEVLSFPDWVAPYRHHWFENRFGGGSGFFRHEFSARERIDGNHLVIEWQGMYRKGQVEKKEGKGSFRIDLKTGRVKTTFPDENVKPEEKPAAVGKNTVGNYEIIVEDTTDGAPAMSRLYNRTLKVKDKETGKQLWQHQLKSYTVSQAPQ